jgi:hypothetical protein
MSEFQAALVIGGLLGFVVGMLVTAQVMLNWKEKDDQSRK